MKISKIIKLVKQIGLYYNDYDIHLTKYYFEVKFSPRKHPQKDIVKEETVFVQREIDEKRKREDLYFNLHKELNKIETEFNKPLTPFENE